MPKHRTSRPNIPFNGTNCTRYDNGYVWNKVVFTIAGSVNLQIKFYSIPSKNMIEFYMANFQNYTAREVIVNINDFNVSKGIITEGDWGRHFEDGILEVWHGLDLPFGWMPPITRVWLN